jgi:hypothetical protein
MKKFFTKKIEGIRKFWRELHWTKAFGLIPVPHQPQWGAEEWRPVNPAIDWIMTKEQSCQHPGCWKGKTVEHWEEDFGRGWIRKYPEPKIRRLFPEGQQDLPL